MAAGGVVGERELPCFGDEVGEEVFVVVGVESGVGVVDGFAADAFGVCSVEDEWFSEEWHVVIVVVGGVGALGGRLLLRLG